MAEQIEEVPKKKAKAGTEAKTSVRSYQQGVDAEKQKMSAYSKKLGTTVKSLKADFKKHKKEMKDAALMMGEEGAKLMDDKVSKFKQEIRNQIKENKEAVSSMEKNVKYFISEIENKKKQFQSYARGPFGDYIKAFWGR